MATARKELQSLDEYVNGIDGDDEDALGVQLRDAMKEAKEKGIDRIEAECRTAPAGTNRSSQAWVRTFEAEAAHSLVLAGLHRSLIGSPGEGFSGELEIRFRQVGNTSNRLASYRRKLRIPLVDDPDSAAPDGGRRIGGAGLTKSQHDHYVRPWMDQALRASEAGIGMMHAAARMMQAAHPPAMNGPGPEGSMLGNLMGGVLSAAAADQGTGKAGQQLISSGVKVATQPRAYLPAPSLTPHRSGPGFDTPSQDDPFTVGGSTAPAAPATLSREQVEAWARANPADAERLGRQLFAERMRGG